MPDHDFDEAIARDMLQRAQLDPDFHRFLTSANRRRQIEAEVDRRRFRRQMAEEQRRNADAAWIAAQPLRQRHTMIGDEDGDVAKSATSGVMSAISAKLNSAQKSKTTALTTTINAPTSSSNLSLTWLRHNGLLLSGAAMLSIGLILLLRRRT